MNRAAHQGPRVAGRRLVPAVAWHGRRRRFQTLRPQPRLASGRGRAEPSTHGRRARPAHAAAASRSLCVHWTHTGDIRIFSPSRLQALLCIDRRRPREGRVSAQRTSRRGARRGGGGGGCVCGGGEGIGGSRRSGPGYRRGIWRVGRCAAAHAEGTRRMRRSKRERLSLAESGLSEAMRRRTRPGRWWWWSQERGVWIERAAVGQMPQKSGDRILNGFSCPHLLVVRRRSWGAGSKGWPHGRGWRPTPSSCCAGRARGGRGER